MAVRMTKPWMEFNEENVSKVACHLGVYQLADDSESIVYIGVADATTKFGLKGELERLLNSREMGASIFRLEINMAYRTRHLELLQTFYFDHKELPRGNSDMDPMILGKLRPGGCV